MKCGVLEPSGTVRACTGFALILPSYYTNSEMTFYMVIGYSLCYIPLKVLSTLKVNSALFICIYLGL